MADQILPLDESSVQRLVEGGISMRVIVPASEFSSQKLTANVTIPRNTEMRSVDQVRAGVSMNDSVAGVVFPEVSGRIDFIIGFAGTSRGLYGWCRELFLYHWEQARKLA
jgi:predicted transcriptional regulator